MTGKSKMHMKKNRSQEEEVLESELVNDAENNKETAGFQPEGAEDQADLEMVEDQKPDADGVSEEEKLRKALAESQDQYLRLQAEFQNFRKRKERELGEAIRFANSELLLKLLPILDNFERTLDAIEKTDNLSAIKEGIALVDQSMKKQLEKTGLVLIESVGESFDVDLHEAITSVPVEEGKKGKVIEEVEKGYKFKDKVLRFSKVIVGE